jgi:hypothetical protein
MAAAEIDGEPGMKMRAFSLALLACTSLSAAPAGAGVIGFNTPAQPISAARIVALPASERPAWTAYLARSEAQEKADRAALAAELKPGQAAPPKPQTSHGGDDNGMPLDREPAWYGSAEARHVADVIVSYQTPAGGWSKNQNRAGPPRLLGQPYASDNNSRHSSEADFDAARDPDWGYVGTLDNDATITELRFLAKVAGRTPGAVGEPYRQSILRGVRYLLNAQMPNGGWPQVWPLQGGYHDAITFNDNAVSEAAALLTAVGDGQDDSASCRGRCAARPPPPRRAAGPASSPPRSASAVYRRSGASRPIRSAWSRSPAATSSRRPCRPARAPTCCSI